LEHLVHTAQAAFRTLREQTENGVGVVGIVFFPEQAHKVCSDQAKGLCDRHDEGAESKGADVEAADSVHGVADEPR
jgi:hypothetical protein